MDLKTEFTTTKCGYHVELPRPSLKNGLGKYVKNTAENRVSENHHGSFCFHDHFPKPSWKQKLSRRLLPWSLLKNGRESFCFHNGFLKTIVENSQQIQTKPKHALIFPHQYHSCSYQNQTERSENNHYTTTERHHHHLLSISLSCK